MKNFDKLSQHLPDSRCGMGEHMAVMDFDKAMKNYT
jgi:hypothetical protein